MQIILANQSSEKGADIFSIARLLTMLTDYKETIQLEAHKQATLNLWIKYLDQIENKITASDLKGKDLPTKFNLPFEQDFLAELNHPKGKPIRRA